MSKRDTFIKEVKVLVENNALSAEAVEYFNVWSASDAGKDAPKFTENGEKVLRGMQETKDKFGGLFKSKDLGEEIGLTSKTVSGAMRKLVTDGYVTKVGSSPVIYELTDKGINEKFDAE